MQPSMTVFSLGPYSFERESVESCQLQAEKEGLLRSKHPRGLGSSENPDVNCGDDYHFRLSFRTNSPCDLTFFKRDRSGNGADVAPSTSFQSFAHRRNLKEPKKVGHSRCRWYSSKYKRRSEGAYQEPSCSLDGWSETKLKGSTHSVICNHQASENMKTLWKSWRVSR